MSFQERLEQLEAGHIALMAEHEVEVRRNDRAWRGPADRFASVTCSVNKTVRMRSGEERMPKPERPTSTGESAISSAGLGNLFAGGRKVGQTVPSAFLPCAAGRVP